MAVTIDGTTGITTPSLTNTGAFSLVDLTITGNTIIGNETTDTFVVGVNGIVKDTFGNVGIGTSSPAAKLDVGLTGAQTVPAARFYSNYATIQSLAGFSIYNNVSGGLVDTALVYGNIPQSYLTFGHHNGTSYSERMRIDSSGNLGLGVTPSAWNSSYKSIQLGSGGSVASHTSLPWLVLNANYYIDNVGAGTARYIQNGYAPRYLLRGDDGTHLFYTTPSGTAGNAVTFTQAMTLNASGFLGIGQTTPVSFIDVYGSGAYTYARFWRSDEAGYGGRVGNGNTLLGAAAARSLGLDGFAGISFGIAGLQVATFDSSGNLGIGTGSPYGKLNVSNAGAAGFEFFTNAPGGGTGTYIQSYNRSGSAYVDTYYYAASHTWRTSASATSMVLDSSGNVGIGTSSPSYKLDINTGVAGVVQRWNTNSVSMLAEADHLGNGNWFLSPQGTATFNVKTGGSTRLTVDSSGNVGIGIATPSKKFEVYTSANSLQIGAIVRNDQAGIGVAAIGFNVASNAGSDASVSKAGIGLVRNSTFGRGVLTFYNDNSAANTDFTTANAVMSIDATGVLGFNSGYGSVATAYGCRAWVNFDGTTASPSTIRGSGNVTSVTKNSTGNYTVNFTSALVDVNYTCTGTCEGNGETISVSTRTGRTTSAMPLIVTRMSGGANVQSDNANINVAVLR